MPDVPDVIQAKAFQLVDDNGKVHAELTMHQGHPELKLLSPEGETRLSASVIHDQPYLILGNHSGSWLQATVYDGHPSVTLHDATPRSTILETMREGVNCVISLGTGAEGKMYLSFFSHGDNYGGSLRAEVESGKATLSLIDKELHAKGHRTVVTTDGIKKNRNLYGEV